MKQSQNFTILIWAYFRANDKHATLYARITIDGKRAGFSLGRKVTPNLWDAKNNLVKGKSPEALEANEFIELVKGELRQIYYQLKATGKPVTAEAIKNKYLGVEVLSIDEQRKKKTLIEAFDHHNDRMKELIGKDVALGTYKRCVVTLGKVKAFLKHEYKLEDVPLAELKYEFIDDFDAYLKVHDKLCQNTCIRYLKVLKKVVKIAFRKEWISRNPFEGFRCIADEVEREVLMPDELQIMMEKKFPSKRLEEIRDIFIFSCFTGYAYAEVRALTPDNIRVGLDGEKWIFIKRQKTDNPSNVMLLPIALGLIEKYKDHPVCVSSGKLFPVKSNQKYNDYLKEIGAMCGFKNELSTHIARHTFATTVALANDVPIESVSAMLGHKSLRTTQIYAKVAQQKLSRDMKTLRQKLGPGQDPALDKAV